MPSSKSKLEDYFEERFGVPQKFWKNYSAFENENSIWVRSEEIEEPERMDTVAAGIRALRKQKFGFKPTTYILQFLGDEISRNVVELKRKELDKVVFQRESLESKRISNLSRGFVALKFSGEILGCGLKTRNGLKTQIPKARSKKLQDVLED